MSDSFAHALRLDRIFDGMRMDLSADEQERGEIARRLRLTALDRLDAHARLDLAGDRVHASGRLAASVTQSCVVTGEPVQSRIDEPFEIIFMPEPRPERGDEEVELAESDCDTVFHDGATLDLGSAIADSLALAIDPYPRSPGADAVLKEAGVISEEQAGPFATLAQLRRSDGEAS